MKGAPRSYGVVVLLSITLAPFEAAAQLFERDFDEQPWVEQQTRLPAFPQAGNLIKIPLETLKSYDVAVDASSIDIGGDGVVRYVLVARSPAGAENISFEGIRCETRERKLYAIGKSDKTWVQARNTAWASFASNPGSYQGEIARVYLCQGNTSFPTRGEALQNLRNPESGRPPMPAE